jgi:hypothetical protein
LGAAIDHYLLLASIISAGFEDSLLKMRIEEVVSVGGQCQWGTNGSSCVALALGAAIVHYLVPASIIAAGFEDSLLKMRTEEVVRGSCQCRLSVSVGTDSSSY